MHFHRIRFVYDWIEDRHKPSLEMPMAHWRNKNKRIGCTMDRLVPSHFAFTLRTTNQQFNTKFNWIKSTGVRLWLIRLLSRPILFRFHSNISNNCLRWPSNAMEMIAMCGVVAWFTFRLLVLFTGVVGFCSGRWEAMREFYANKIKAAFFRGKWWMKIIWMNEKKKQWYLYSRKTGFIHRCTSQIMEFIYVSISRYALTPPPSQMSHGSQFAFNLFFSCDYFDDDDDRRDSFNEYIALRPLERRSQYSTQSHFHF